MSSCQNCNTPMLPPGRFYCDVCEKALAPATGSPEFITKESALKAIEARKPEHHDYCGIYSLAQMNTCNCQRNEWEECVRIIQSLPPVAVERKPLDGSWMDEWGSCRVCGGEIPHGHSNNCDIYKMQRRIQEQENRPPVVDERVEKLKAALIGWRNYFQADIPMTGEEMEKQGEQFTQCWTEAEHLLSELNQQKKV